MFKSRLKMTERDKNPTNLIRKFCNQCNRPSWTDLSVLSLSLSQRRKERLIWNLEEGKHRGGWAKFIETGKDAKGERDDDDNDENNARAGRRCECVRGVRVRMWRVYGFRSTDRRMRKDGLTNG